jgi:hypothetical protein
MAVPRASRTVEGITLRRLPLHHEPFVKFLIRAAICMFYERHPERLQRRANTVCCFRGSFLLQT